MADLSKENMDALKQYLDEMVQGHEDLQIELDGLKENR